MVNFVAETQYTTVYDSSMGTLGGTLLGKSAEHNLLVTGVCERHVGDELGTTVDTLGDKVGVDEDT